MVPSALVSCERLPLTAHGKVDRAALLALPLLRQRVTRSRPPATGAEQTLAGIWQDVLQLESVGAAESFFELGGHSLLLTQVQARVKRAFGRELSMLELFEHPTIESLAAHLSASPAPELPRARGLLPAEAGHAVAIIGMAGQFPGAKDLEQFWRNLAAGVESISRLSDEALAESGVPASLSDRSEYVRAKGVLEGAELFDADFFGINPREARQMDPQQRRFLECAWEALEDAGYPPGTHGASVGVFATSSATSYQPLPASEEPAGIYQLKLGLESDFLATRVSYKLDLHGPGMTVRTGCSGSLVAVHLACRSILSGECELALAGGVSISVPLAGGYVYQPGMILSPDGHCRAFDARAGGTVRGNGVGAVVLKRLERALADGDTVHAVIRGTALNNDGAGKLGYTAPSLAGQAEVIARAHEVAGIQPHEVSFVETHGTGTPLGDPVEAAALVRAFQRGAGPQSSCALGATKPNIGHLDAAAGIAGLIKTVLCLRHRQLPPVAHFEKPNPSLGLDGTPFFINARLSDWDSARGPAADRRGELLWHRRHQCPYGGGRGPGRSRHGGAGALARASLVRANVHGARHRREAPGGVPGFAAGRAVGGRGPHAPAGADRLRAACGARLPGRAGGGAGPGAAGAGARARGALPERGPGQGGGVPLPRPGRAVPGHGARALRLAGRLPCRGRPVRGDPPAAPGRGRARAAPAGGRRRRAHPPDGARAALPLHRGVRAGPPLDVPGDDAAGDGGPQPRRVCGRLPRGGVLAGGRAGAHRAPEAG